jgi:hypothetical protein
MDSALLRHYRRFRSAGSIAAHALAAARTEIEWEELEDEGLVEVNVDFDPCGNDDPDFGPYILVGKYRLDTESDWVWGDSVSGMDEADAFDPMNWCLPDIKAETIARYREQASIVGAHS